MSYIEKLTVNGSTYDLRDGKAAHTDDAAVGADTWSSKNIADKLCPSFSESGTVVACEPVAGYPLTVTAEDGATAITRCGKNLWDLKSGVKKVAYLNNSGTTSERYGYEVRLPPGTYTAHCEQIREVAGNEQYIYGYILRDEDNLVIKSAHLRADTVFYTQTITLEEGQHWLICHGYSVDAIDVSKANKLFNTGYNIQIELGSAKTAYEPYQAQVFAPGDTVPATAGTNCLFADKGSIAVTGRKDPNAVIEKLTNAIVALGGNI